MSLTFIQFLPRYEYDRKMSELSCADDDHPLKPIEKQTTNNANNDAESIEGTVEHKIDVN